MGKIIIRGNFTVETDYGFIKNMRQPLEIMELHILAEDLLVRCHRMTTIKSKRECKNNIDTIIREVNNK